MNTDQNVTVSICVNLWFQHSNRSETNGR
jgi:hypothetical protein